MHTPVTEQFQLKYLHDSSACQQCMATRTFYKLKAAPNLHSTRASCGMRLVGLLTYLKRVISVDVVPPNDKAESPCSNHAVCVSKCAAKETQEYKTKQIDQTELPKETFQDCSDVILKSEGKEIKFRGKGISETPCLTSSKAKRKVPKQKATLTSVPKRPKVCTLKRKRNALQNLQSDVHYEDDIFEDERTPHELVQLSDDDLESVDVQNMETPLMFSMTPREEANSPNYEDCYSPTELKLNRKEAEEYQYRRTKRRKSMRNGGMTGNQASSSQDKTTMLLEAACRVLTEQIKNSDMKNIENEDEKEDYYFSDSSDD